MNTGDHAKTDLLVGEGYRHDPSRMVYHSLSAKKVFSYEWVEDHSLEDVQQALQKQTNADRWTFFFNDPPVSGEREAALVKHLEQLGDP